MARINLKLALVALCIVVVLTLAVYNPVCNEGLQPRWDRRSTNGESRVKGTGALISKRELFTYGIWGTPF